MSISIRIDDALYQTAKVRANAEMRSIPQQVSYWAKVGRAALDNPDLPIEFVRDVLVAMEEESEPFDLSGA
ncbi:TA system antitoxin ParD family protein [Propionivibrio sp.]|uniref:TA system antitoxin ParD family protein n=1 Tax=Propionivibrio sp. TaxID=2212460 RepID=UPI003BF13B7E